MFIYRLVISSSYIQCSVSVCHWPTTILNESILEIHIQPQNVALVMMKNWWIKKSYSIFNGYNFTTYCFQSLHSTAELPVRLYQAWVESRWDLYCSLRCDNYHAGSWSSRTTRGQRIPAFSASDASAMRRSSVWSTAACSPLSEAGVVVAWKTDGVEEEAGCSGLRCPRKRRVGTCGLD